MNKQAISTEFPYRSHMVDVGGAKMHYIDEGRGDPILFLHGIPASSYVWRNVIPHLSSLGRCIAPDLMGMGKSDKPDIEYTIFDHIKYIDKFIETLKLDKIVLVMHGWGSVIGFDYAMRHENKIKGLIFYEAYLHPLEGDEVSLPYLEQMRDLLEHESVTHGMDFVERVIPQTMMRTLSSKELAYYQQPFMTKGSHKPLMQYLNDLPCGDNAKPVDKLIANYSKKLMQSKLPKLMLYSVPGFLTSMTTAMWAKNNLKNLEIVDVGEEFHYAQESNPAGMGETMSIWLQGIEQ